jgi:hypothetical protein
MTRGQKARHLLLPWAGLIGAFAGWSLTHQIGSNFVFDRCGATPRLAIALLGLAGLALIVAGGLVSLRHYRRAEDDSATRRFISLVAAGAAGIFAMALLWQTLSSFIIPRCFG